MTTVMSFLEWDKEKLKWIPIPSLTKTFNVFSDALQKSEEIWDEILPLQKKGRYFTCTLKTM